MGSTVVLCLNTYIYFINNKKNATKFHIRFVLFYYHCLCNFFLSFIILYQSTNLTKS